MQTSINNSATFFCYTSTIPSPSNRGEYFGRKNSDLRKPHSASIVIVNPNDVILNGRIVSLLNEISNLQNNWDGEGAFTLSENILKKAYSLVYMLEKRGQQIFNVAPGPNGEIMLDIRNSKKTKSLEIIFYQDKSVVVSFPETENPIQKPFLVIELPILLNWLDQK